jgi:hypothetical protein
MEWDNFMEVTIIIPINEKIPVPQPLLAFYIAMMTDEFINDMVESAGNLGQFFVGVPEEEMIAALYDLEADLEAQLQPLGADVAALLFLWLEPL